MSREAILERERRWKLAAGLSGLLVAPLFFLVVFVNPSISGPSDGLPTDSFSVIEANSAEFALLAVAQSLACAAMIPPLLYLFAAVRARSDRVPTPMVGFALIGPLLLVGWSVFTQLGRDQIASDFVAQSGRGGDVYTLLSSLGESGLNSIGSELLFPAQLGLLIAMVYIPLQAMRVGLLTRFFATFGMALGATLIVLGPNALLFITLWFTFLGLLILNRAPGVRPPAWDAGIAIPWPKPGEQAREREEPASPEEFSRDRDAGGQPADGEPADAPAPSRATPIENPNAARRERAKRKKRKRRA